MWYQNECKKPHSGKNSPIALTIADESNPELAAVAIKLIKMFALAFEVVIDVSTEILPARLADSVTPVIVTSPADTPVWLTMVDM